MTDESEEAVLIYLEKVLVHGSNDDVRAVAAEKIGELESERGIEVLAKGLNDPDEDVRETIVEALGKIGGTNALPLLREALKDGNADIREAAADLIEEIEEDENETE
ncbi:MAG: HEAT repeat domain-containing protein [Thermodesulfobacteriota bacterium]|nr:HEAT repeat domain-containing protein [Thermodesulfobacteriota bacterium]